MNEATHLPPLWALWRNPIVIRCWRSRMRAKGFIPWAVVVMVLGAFLFFTVFNSLTERFDASTVSAARAAFLPILVLQGVLLLLAGTGAVTAGLTQEEDEGMIEFQRLTPLPPAWKIVGYLFGLPVREYVLVAMTMPFTMASVWLGNLPMEAVAKVYAVLLSSSVLYHLTGYVAGFTIRKRRMGTRLVQGMVVVLYLVLPQLSNFGYVVFEHLTIRPVFQEQMSHYVREGFARMMPREEKAEVAFFGLELPQIVFSLTIQGALIVVFLSMVRRKWVDASRHNIGKATGLIILAGTALVVLGNLLPLLDDGRVFPTRLIEQAPRRSMTMSILRAMVPKSSAAEAGMLVALLSMLLSILGLFLLMQMAPSRVEAIRGWRRAGRLGLGRLPWRSDEASALPWAVLCGMAAGATVWVFGHQMGVSRWMEGKSFASGMVPWIGLFPVITLASAVTVVETWEKKGSFLLVIGLWVVPALVMLVLGATSDQGAVLGFYIGTLSPLSAPFCGMAATDAKWAAAGIHGQVAFYCGLAVHFTILCGSLLYWVRARKQARMLANRVG